MNTFFKFLVVLAFAFPLSGCVTSMAKFSLGGLNAVAYCPVGLHSQSQRITNFIETEAYGGMAVADVFETLGEAEVYREVTLRGGAKVDVWQYRVGHPKCRGLREPEFAPIVFQNGVLIGAGDAYFEEHIAGRAVRSVVLNGEGLDGQKVMERVVLLPLNMAY